MFRMLIHPSSGACDYLVRYCVGCNVLIWGVLVLCNGIGCWWCGIRVQAALGYHITNSQSRYLTPTRLKSAHYSLHNNAPSSRKLLKMDVLTSETCWAVNWHNKASVIKLVNLYSNLKCFDKFNKLLNIKYYEHPFSGSQVVPCSGTGRFDYAFRGAAVGLTTPKQLAQNYSRPLLYETHFYFYVC